MSSNPGASRSTGVVSDRTMRGGMSASARTADVCIIGAGSAAVSLGYLLAREGRSVVIVDDDPIGSGETSRTSALLSSAIEDGFERMEQLHGAAGARLAFQSHAAAIDHIAAIVRDAAIDCDFRRVDSFLFAAPGDPPQGLAREFAAAKRAGAVVHSFERSPIPGLAPGPCLRFSDQVQMDPLRYLDGLRARFVRLGGEILRNANATTIHDGEPVRVEFEGGCIVTADSVVIATDSPFTTLVAGHSLQSEHRTIVVASECPPGKTPQALVCYSADPPCDQCYRWSGQVLETRDGIAYVGREPRTEHVYHATGDADLDLASGTIAGMLLSDLIVGRDNLWKELYAPDRKPWRASIECLLLDLDLPAQSAERVKTPGAAAIDGAARGSDAVLRRRAQLVATGRDSTLGID